MTTRRDLMIGSVGSLLFGRAAGADEKRAPRSIDSSSSEATTGALIALPGKRPLIRHSFRPPNFETPLADLRTPFTANAAFFVRYHLAQIPEVDPRTWRLRIGGGSAQRALELSLDDLKSDFERVSIAAINQCSGNRRGLFSPRAPGLQWGHGAMGNAVWSGVRLRDVLARTGVKGNALEVVFDGADAGVLPGTPDFVKSLPIDRARDEHSLIAFEMNGEPLPHWHGSPVRLVVPGWTATYWIKHLKDIRVEPAAFAGFWMKSGYRIPTGSFPGARFAAQETAETTPITEILVNSLVTSHVSGARIERGRPADLRGWAWDGGSGISAVEVSVDGARTWRQVSLAEDLGRFAWRGFHWPLDTSRPGAFSVAVRAASRDGARQPDRLTPNPSGYHHNMIQTLAMEIV